MAIEIISAVYEDGVFKPLRPVNLEEGQKVTIIPEAKMTPEEEARLRELGYKMWEDMPDEEFADFMRTLKRGS